MTHDLPDLPYDADALAPHISAETLEVHHGKHHQGYLDGVNDAVADTPKAKMTLTELLHSAVREDDQSLFNDAAQALNHAFFWTSMSPERTDVPGILAPGLDRDFGGLDGFRQAFQEAGAGQFGSGWVWLILKEEHRLEVVSTSNADTPFAGNDTPLLVCDVWEHAYYLDYKNDRGGFLKTFTEELINWDFAAQNYAAATGSNPSW